MPLMHSFPPPVQTFSRTMSRGGDNLSDMGYSAGVEGFGRQRTRLTGLRERAAKAVAEGEIARNLSGKRTVDGFDTLESRGFCPAPKV
jgi:hypothetical protein